MEKCAESKLEVAREDINSKNLQKFNSNYMCNPTAYIESMDMPLLHCAIEKGVDEKMIRYFLNLGVDVDARNEQGLTPLQLVLYNPDQSHLVKLFLQYGANVNATWKNGLSALDIAALYQSADVLNLLLMHGLDTNKVDFFGTTVYENLANLIESREKRFNELGPIDEEQCDSSNFDNCPYLDSEFGPPSLLTRLLPNLRAMTENFARLTAANRYVDYINLQVLSDPFTNPYYELCTNELERIRVYEEETGLPCFLILTENKFGLGNCKRDELMEAFKDEEFSESFPIYRNHLLTCVEVGFEMRNLIKKCINFLKNTLELPLTATLIVISELNELDLKRFCVAFEPIQDK